jgi:hypothetical protein
MRVHGHALHSSDRFAKRAVASPSRTNELCFGLHLRPASFMNFGV